MKKTFFAFFASLILLSAAIAADAHGGGVAKITNEPIGDFVVSVWLNPEPARTGDIHITVGLAKNQKPILNHGIEVQLLALDRRAPARTAPATHENAVSRFLYEADIVVPSAGEYEIIVSVDGTDDTVSFLMPVIGESWLNSPFTITAVVITVVIVLGYRFFSRRGGNG